MTVIEFDDQGSKLKLKAEGHATGSIELCAAISALTIAFDEYLKGWGENHKTVKEDGKIEIECDASLQTLGAYRLVQRALILLAKENPEYLKVGGGNLDSKI